MIIKNANTYENIVDIYKKLNDKCDEVLEKIRKRKEDGGKKDR